MSEEERRERRREKEKKQIYWQEQKQKDKATTKPAHNKNLRFQQKSSESMQITFVIDWLPIQPDDQIPSVQIRNRQMGLFQIIIYTYKSRTSPMNRMTTKIVIMCITIVFSECVSSQVLVSQVDPFFSPCQRTESRRNVVS